MIFPFCRRTTVAAILISLSFSGCGLIKKSPVTYRQIPVSNTTAGEKAIKEALINSGIQAINSVGEYSLEISRDIKGMALSTGTEFLISKGWKLNTKESGIPNVSISLDTVFVKINSVKSSKEKSISRHSEAKISVVVNHPDRTKSIYIGTGVYEDNPPSEWVRHNRGNEDFVTYSSDFRQMYTAIKPVLYGITGTAFIWLFYSYRN